MSAMRISTKGRYAVRVMLDLAVNKMCIRDRASYENGGKLLVCGNGGSASDSDHIVGELMKGFYKKRPLSEAEKEKFGGLSEHLQGALPAISLAGHPADVYKRQGLRQCPHHADEKM